MPESSARPRNRDRRRLDNLVLDDLTGAESGHYRSGLWIGPVVTSQDLAADARGMYPSDPDGVAELAARVRVQWERMEAS